MKVTHNLLSETIESSEDTAVVVIHLYVITDTVCSPKPQDAGAVKQTAVHNVRQHLLSIVKQLPGFLACSTIQKFQTCTILSTHRQLLTIFISYH